MKTDIYKLKQSEQVTDWLVRKSKSSGSALKLSIYSNPEIITVLTDNQQLIPAYNHSRS